MVSRRSAAIVAIVVGIAFVVVVVMMSDSDSDDPLEAARDLASDPEGFDQGMEAAETLAAVAERLNDAIAQCDPAESGVGRCTALAEASAYVQVTAVRALECTAPGRFEARTRVAGYLDAIADLGSESTARPPVPALLQC